MLERAISVTVSLLVGELTQLDEFAHHRHLTRSGAVREALHRAGIIKLRDPDEKPPGPCEHPRDSIIKEDGHWRCEDCGMVSYDGGEEWNELLPGTTSP